jgi:hypothetical protein
MSLTIGQKRKILDAKEYKYTLDQWKQLDSIIKLHKAMVDVINKKNKAEEVLDKIQNQITNIGAEMEKA